ncbi:alternate-type signal peptide domain-containing protein [Nocardioides sp. MAH-18]|uniref:Alternate-type signal peptide domain-containing protein n=1 Tax=Nocardioides agri TaxID=2682843 RepID=A0A6L6XLH0_9ACTN|nr:MULTISPECIES: alternate-type signal peptide domain-containing protein [unclassified Nocardioides]MBA2953070.1 alternate-type signal peptide domain-containing protein [Nocardioides sp. CGMCC 1.13656]MVQ47940.1 alternate-type signal peptide domain-containing protein [Nocardioides sp. MAH-18]
MNKTTKGALAASAAAVLLLGGAGSLAYWNSTETVAGTTIGSGYLKLVPTGSTACEGWKLDGETGFAPATDKIVPGDVLTQVCRFTVNAKGKHLKANFDVTTPTWNGASSAGSLTNELSVAADYQVGTNSYLAPTKPTNVSIADNTNIVATVRVTFNEAAATNASNVAGGLSALLNDITVTATSAH